MKSWQLLRHSICGRRLLWLAVVALFGLYSCVPAGEYEVIRVADGDTVTLLDENRQKVRVRLYGIDAPERGQPYSKVATERLKSLIVDGVFWEELSKDHYGRSVANLYTPKGEWINLTLVEEGLAWHYTQYSNSLELEMAERRAQKRKLGLWQQPKPEAPWEHRKKKRAKRKTR